MVPKRRTHSCRAAAPAPTHHPPHHPPQCQSSTAAARTRAHDGVLQARRLQRRLRAPLPGQRAAKQVEHRGGEAHLAGACGRRSARGRHGRQAGVRIPSTHSALAAPPGAHPQRQQRRRRQRRRRRRQAPSSSSCRAALAQADDQHPLLHPAQPCCSDNRSSGSGSRSPRLVTSTNCCTPAAVAASTSAIDPSPSTFLKEERSASEAPTAHTTCARRRRSAHGLRDGTGRHTGLLGSRLRSARRLLGLRRDRHGPARTARHQPPSTHAFQQRTTGPTLAALPMAAGSVSGRCRSASTTVSRPSSSLLSRP